MPCFFPLHGFRSRSVNKNGKYYVVFNQKDGYKDFPVTVPCGQCIGCRQRRINQWAVRIMHEAQLHVDNCFCTLTYNKENLPVDESLHVEDFQKFMKRLRKHYVDKKIRYFHCGEYGDDFSRPHYHVILFGITFYDTRFHKNVTGTDLELLKSNTLDKIWGLGYTHCGELNLASAKYVASYVFKKINGEDSFEHYTEFNKETGEILHDRRPEYVTMSRRPGIASGWFERFHSEVYNTDSVIVQGREMKVPKYYDEKLKELDMDKYNDVKFNRSKDFELLKDDFTDDRMVVKETVARLNLKNKKRSFEND